LNRVRTARPAVQSKIQNPESQIASWLLAAAGIALLALLLVGLYIIL
jgi:hypothetical protein